jgi:hypothetical protein
MPPRTASGDACSLISAMCLFMRSSGRRTRVAHRRGRTSEVLPSYPEKWFSYEVGAFGDDLFHASATCSLTVRSVGERHRCDDTNPRACGRRRARSSCSTQAWMRKGLTSQGIMWMLSTAATPTMSSNRWTGSRTPWRNRHPRPSSSVGAHAWRRGNEADASSALVESRFHPSSPSSRSD